MDQPSNTPPFSQDTSNPPTEPPEKEKNSLLNKLLLELSIVFSLIFLGLCLETYRRGILITNGDLNPKLLNLLFERSIGISLIFVLGYRLLKSSILLATSSLSMANQATRKSTHHVVELLYDVFITLGIILISSPVRPILQETQIKPDSVYVSQAFVRFDAIPSIIILSIVAIPLLILIFKQLIGVEKILKLVVIMSTFLIVGYFNNQLNYTARVYEARGSWASRDWVQQQANASKTLAEAQTNEEKAEAYFWMGVSQNRQKNYNKAIEYQLQAITLVPDYAAAHASLANAYLSINELNNALEHANKCVQYDPNYAWCYSALANYYGVTGKIDEAIRNAQKANQLDPHEADLQAQLQSLIEYQKQQNVEKDNK